MVLMSCQQLSKSMGGRPLFRDVNLTIEKSDRIGLIGPNGSGKSTFLRILARQDVPDEGEVIYRRDLRVGYVVQSSRYDSRSVLEQVISQVPQVPAHEAETQATITLGRLGFNDFDQAADTLSGGWRKRLDIACELVKDPDILLLDEPTNHLDLEGIEWLEQFLRREKLCYVVITHDRHFLSTVTNRMIEINPSFPGGIFNVDGSYPFYLERREEFLAGQREQQRSLESKVRREVDWLRQTPKARTTKSRSRMAEAYRLQDELGDIKTRNTERRSHIDFVSSERETRRLLVGKNMEKTLGERTLFKGLDLQLSPGSRLAIAGTNGAGKTTLLKLIAGSIQPDQGTIKRAENLKVVLFDQHREQLPLDLTLKEALCPTGDEVYYRGRHIHVNGWAQRFLFPKERIELPIRHLSGGERARILIARLMLKEADILLLDEPTNDLDIPTLELLEDSLVDFPGALVLITHDRTLLSRVATEVIGIGCGHDNYYFADLEQWERYRDRYLSEQQRSQEKTVPASQSPANPKKKTKLSYKEKRELEALEAEIEELESSQASCQATTEDPGIQSDASKLQAACEELQSVQERLETCYHRWEELSMKEQ